MKYFGVRKIRSDKKGNLTVGIPKAISILLDLKPKEALECYYDEENKSIVYRRVEKVED